MKIRASSCRVGGSTPLVLFIRITLINFLYRPVGALHPSLDRMPVRLPQIDYLSALFALELVDVSREPPEVVLAHVPGPLGEVLHHHPPDACPEAARPFRKRPRRNVPQDLVHLALLNFLLTGRGSRSRRPFAFPINLRWDYRKYP